MIHRGRRQADRFHGELHVVYVRQPGLSAEDTARLDQHLAAAREASARIEVLPPTDGVRAILAYAGRHGISQIFVGHTQKTGWGARLRANFIERLIHQAEGIDVRVFPSE
jgi:K+-sensing histidine kinase KdpD